MNFIDLKTQYLEYKSEIDSRMQAVLESGCYILGPEVTELEEKLAEMAGAKHAITVSSGTDSLELALLALDLGAGDEVITSPFTWISPAEVIMRVGATPVFADISLDDFNIDPRAVEAAITPRTKAIMPVSLFGQMADMESLNSIADKHNLAVIEDAAQSFGAKRNGIPSCGASLIGSTSFYPTKPLGCYGDGGALFTSDDELAEKMRIKRTHGGKVRNHHTHLGMNGRFDTLQAAVILGKLPFFGGELRARTRIGEYYSSNIDELRKTTNSDITTPATMPENTHVYAQYTLRSPRRDSICAKLKEKDIPTAIHYPKCLHEQPVFESLNYKTGDFPEAERAAREVFSLPMHAFLKETDQDKVIEAIKAARAI